MVRPILYESHCHTPLCKHSIGSPEDFADVAEQRGLRGLIVTCHNPLPRGCSPEIRMAAEEFTDYLDMVDRARRKRAGRVDVRLGLEADYLPGYHGWLKRQLRSAVFDYVLGAIHPQLPEFRARCSSRDPLELQRHYFQLLGDAAESGLFDCLSHPDSVKNETADDWYPPRLMDDVRQALDRIAAAGLALELNTSGLNKALGELSPFPEMLVEMRFRRIPVVLGADAHEPWRVADNFELAFDLLSDCGYTHVSHFLRRQRHDVPISAARRTLRPADWTPAREEEDPGVSREESLFVGEELVVQEMC